MLEPSRPCSWLFKGFSNQQSWSVPKGRGVGKDILSEFLGKSWEKWMIKEALSAFELAENGKIDDTAVEKIPQGSSRHFSLMAQTYHLNTSSTSIWSLVTERPPEKDK